MTEIADFFKDEAIFQHNQSILAIRSGGDFEISPDFYRHQVTKSVWLMMNKSRQENRIKKFLSSSFEDNKENLNVTKLYKKNT